MSIREELANQIHTSKEASENDTLAPLIQALIHGRICLPKQNPLKRTIKLISVLINAQKKNITLLPM